MITFPRRLKSLLKKVRAQFVGTPAGETVLSVIVPAYNVEDYLEECLASLVNQKLRSLEVIVIDDGSTDRTLEIARGFAKMDRRVKVFTQKNAGLGAVRNRGVSLAVGRYITFVDSDDFIPVDAYESMVGSLERSGSDFAIGQIYRRRGNKYIYPAWSRELHSRDRVGITLLEYPEILRDFYSPNKVYSAHFWRSNNLAFREKVLFEDQPLITQVYTLAKKFDVLTVLSYCWIIREDNSSLSSNLHEKSKLSARIQAAKLTRDFLNSHGDQQVLRAWQRIQITNHLPGYVRSLLRSDDESALLVRDLVYTCVSADELAALPNIDPRHLLTVGAAMESSPAEVRRTLLSGIADLSNRRREIHSGLVSFEADEAFKFAESFPKTTFDVANIPVLAGVLHLSMGESGLDVRGFAVRQYLPKSEAKIDGLQILLTKQDSQPIVARVEEYADDRINVLVPDGQVDHSGDGWAACFSSEDLGAADVGKWTLAIRYNTDGIVEEKEIFRNDAGYLDPLQRVGFFGERGTAILGWQNNASLNLEIRQRRCVLTQAVSNATSRTLTVEARVRKSKPKAIRVIDGDKVRAFAVRTSEVSDRIELSAELPLDARGRLVVGYADGQQVDVFGSLRSLPLARHAVIALGARGGATLAPDNLIVDDVTMSEAGFTITLAGDLQPGLVFGASDGIEMIFATAQGDGTYLLPFALFKDIVDRRFTFGVFTESDESIRNEKAFVSTGAGSTFPLEYMVNERLFRFERSKRGMVINVLTPKRSTMHTPFSSQVWQRTGFGPLKPSIYLQCLQGASASDSQLALRDCLRALDPSLRIIWGVESLASVTPPQDERVLVGTFAWKEALETSAIVCVNHELPKWFRSRKGQSVIQTYHGHPFKVMGIARWQNQGVCKEEIAQNLFQRENWTHLLSPSELATRLYREAFPLDYTVLEFGAPRNDDLINESLAMRKRARTQLGLAQDVRTVLYAPTWRDYDADSPWKSGVPQFIDWDRLLSELPADVLVLFRGHPSQAQDASRQEWPERVIDVTTYGSVNELLALADVGVFDYSSIRFDFGLLNKPSIVFVPDENEYFKSSPGLFPFEESVSGPIVHTQTELQEALTESLSGPRRVDNSTYSQRFDSNPDGNAGMRLAEWVLELPAFAPAQQ